MLNIKRSGGSTTGFRSSQPHTPSHAAQSAPQPIPYASLGFVARTSDGQLLRPNAVYGKPTRITYKRRIAFSY